MSARIILPPGSSMIMFCIVLSDVIANFIISFFEVLIIISSENRMSMIINQIQIYANPSFLFDTRRLVFISYLANIAGIFSLTAVVVSTTFYVYYIYSDFIIPIFMTIATLLMYRAIIILPLQFISLILLVGMCWLNINRSFLRVKISVGGKSLFLKKIRKCTLIMEDLMSISEEINKTYMRIMIWLCISLTSQWVYTLACFLKNENIIFPVIVKMISVSTLLVICLTVCDFTSKQVS